MMRLNQSDTRVERNPQLMRIIHDDNHIVNSETSTLSNFAGKEGKKIRIPTNIFLYKSEWFDLSWSDDIAYIQSLAKYEDGKFIRERGVS